MTHDSDPYLDALVTERFGMTEKPTGLYDIIETPSGRFRKWHDAGSLECLNNGVWTSIPEVAQAEILRLRAALAAKQEQCARVALVHECISHAPCGREIASAIRALPVEGE